jgi:hypothetical protein
VSKQSPRNRSNRLLVSEPPRLWRNCHPTCAVDDVGSTACARLSSSHATDGRRGRRQLPLYARYWACSQAVSTGKRQTRLAASYTGANGWRFVQRGAGKGALFWSCYSSTPQVQVPCSYAMFCLVASLASFRCFTGRKKKRKGKKENRKKRKK